MELFRGYGAYLNGMDYTIILIGIAMGLFQLSLYVAYKLSTSKGFEDTCVKSFADQFPAPIWLKFCSGVFEIFPLMGLLGTVAGLLNTFDSLGVSIEGEIEIMGMLKNFAPAMTSTVSGILALLGNMIVNFYFMAKIMHKQQEK